MVNHRNRAYLRIYRRRTRLKRQHGNVDYLWWIRCKQHRPLYDGIKIILILIILWGVL